MANKRKKSTTLSLTLAPPPTSLVQSFRAVEDEITAIADERLVRINLDVPSAVQIGFGAVRGLEPLMPELRMLPKLDIQRIRNLGTYAGAALYAHLRVQDHPRERPLVESLAEEAVPLEAGLFASAHALAHAGLLPASQVAGLRRSRSRGRVRVANNLSTLALLLDEGWSRIKDKTTITRAMVDRAAALGQQLHEELGARRMRPTKSVTALRRTRAQAFTLFTEVYDICRRGVTYLRWHEGDAERFVPSLYLKPGRRRAALVPSELEQPPAEAPDTAPADA